MLWMEMYAAVLGHALASSSMINAASRRLSPLPPTSSRT